MRKSAVLVFALLVSPVRAETLYWRSLDVRAALDAQGKMHVREQHGMVFDGIWNGGERRFRVAQGQSLYVDRVSRIDHGVEIPLQRGDLSQRDHWDYAGDGDTIRWRSRLPSDPPFHHQELDYIINYSLSNVLTTTNGRDYELRHDFAFPDRPGVIQHFTLDFAHDPVWRGADSPLRVVRDNIPLGDGFVVTQHLTFTGAAQPQVQHVAPAYLRPLFLAIGAFIVACGFVWLILQFRAYKDRPETITDDWIARNVLSIRPELLAVAFHGKCGVDAVAAALARMSHEGKLATWVDNANVLHLKLLVPWPSLQGWEQHLVQLMFIGKNETDTNEIQAHYARSGFSPARAIETPLKEKVAHLQLWPEDKTSTGVSAWSAVFTIVGIIAAVVGFASYGSHMLVLIAAIVILMAMTIGAVIAQATAEMVANVRFPFVAMATIVPLAAVTYFFCMAASAPESAAIVILGTAAALAIIGAGRPKMSREKFAVMRRWHAARDYFAAQLRLPQPHLRDDWYPWLLALGLGDHVAKWFSIAGASAPATFAPDRQLRDSSAPAAMAEAKPAWTGGGGAFGGAGASGSWGAVMSTLGGVNGLSISGSSSGDSGGSSFSSDSGSSSSGGGGGGGW